MPFHLINLKKRRTANAITESGSHEMDKVIAAADVMIENDGTKEEFFAKLEEFLKESTHN